MGCDIHMVLQARNYKGEWETRITNIFPGRDYTFFGWLAGIRSPTYGSGCGEKGFPADFQFSTSQIRSARYHENFYMGEHSFGHIMCSKLVRCKIFKHDEEVLLPYKDSVTQLELICGTDLENMRIVYGFDS